MVGREERGEWHLLLSNITVEDDARYQCQVGATETVQPIRSSYAVVTGEDKTGGELRSENILQFWPSPGLRSSPRAPFSL